MIYPTILRSMRPVERKRVLDDVSFGRYRRFGRFVPTADQTWGGTWDHSRFGHHLVGPHVLVSVYENPDLVRVCAWGRDDTGIERDDAVGSGDQWIRWVNGLAIVCQADLLRLGFRWA